MISRPALSIPAANPAFGALTKRGAARAEERRIARLTADLQTRYFGSINAADVLGRVGKLAKEHGDDVTMARLMIYYRDEERSDLDRVLRFLVQNGLVSIKDETILPNPVALSNLGPVLNVYKEWYQPTRTPLPTIC